jgi:sugar phosphate isomerase/epimerase
MLHSGLCSITFRQRSPEEIIALCQKAGIEGIEWGGDVHVPPGDVETAQSIREMTEAAGLTVCSYGAYFRCDSEEGNIGDVIDVAAALGAPVIRLWAGREGSADASEGYRSEVCEHLRRAVVAAREMGMTIALEYHGKTLTDTRESAHRLLEEVGYPELKLYWQPRTAHGDRTSNLEELRAALPKLAHVHAFHWGMGGFKDRYPLAAGRDDWAAYLEPLKQLDDDRFVILEFVKDDSSEQFLEDAATLKALIRQ